MTNDSPRRGQNTAGADAVAHSPQDQFTAPAPSFQSPYEDAPGLEAAMERDRRFLLSEYAREILPGEFPLALVPRGYQPRGSVTVKQIAPGCPIRFPIFFQAVPRDGRPS
jgi:hypothetical protein